MPKRSPRRLAFVVFAGGGARGFAHIGALKAIEKDFYVRGYAGSSAGAIVAALASVGYTADEIFHVKENGELRHILQLCGAKSIPELYGPAWKRVEIAAHLGKPSKNPLARLKKLYLGYRLVRHAVKGKGLLSTEPLRKAINDVLRRKLIEQGALPDGVEDVLFRHIGTRAHAAKTADLKVVATALLSQRLILFSADATPNVSVAEAVTSSLALPGFFEPVRVGDMSDELFADGGLTSNLPVWIFKYEKLHEERLLEQRMLEGNAERWAPGPIPILAFGLAKPPTFRKPDLLASPPTTFAYWVFETAMSGSQSMATNFTEDVAPINLPCDLELTDFDPPVGRLKRAKDAAYDHASSRIGDLLYRRPKIDENLRELLEEAKERIRSLDPARAFKLRACLVAPITSRHSGPAPEAFRVLRMVGDETYTDDRLVLDRGNAVAPRAFLDKRDVAWPRDEVGRGATLGDLMTRYERALVWPALKSVYAVPIFENMEAWDPKKYPLNERRPPPLGVVAFDSDEDLCDIYRNSEFLNWAIAACGTFAPAFVEEMVSC
jgi:NTE family protein